MRKAKVYRNSTFVGMLSKEEDGTFRFEYDQDYFINDKYPAVSLTMPKSKVAYRSPYLFPFFFNMLSEGVNRQVQSRQLQISDSDHFGLLLSTASGDTIGAVRVKEIIKGGS